MTLPARVTAKITRTDGCWLWTGCLNSKGYGVTSANGRRVLAHRFVYEHLVGPIADGMTLDHVRDRGCTNKNCVNPAHLEPVTALENRQRANELITTCRAGHPLTRRPGDKQRRCVVCDVERTRQRRLLARQAVPA
jgi:hypothetical protein